MAIEKCSCEESAHLREGLRLIQRIAGEHTGAEYTEDLAQINNLAWQSENLEPLVGDPSLGHPIP